MLDLIGIMAHGKIYGRSAAKVIAKCASKLNKRGFNLRNALSFGRNFLDLVYENRAISCGEAI